MSLQSLEEKLATKQFMRVHRSFIVNLNKIKTIERNCIVFGKEYISLYPIRIKIGLWNS